MGQNPKSDNLVSLKTVAARYDVSVKFLRAEIARGALPAVKLGKRTKGTLKDVRPVRIAESDLEKWLEPIPAGEKKHNNEIIVDLRKQ